MIKKALWNTIIGEGDAKRPSSKTMIHVDGDLDNFSIQIINGNRTVVNETISGKKYSGDCLIQNTGCDLLTIIVKNSGKVMKDSIDFRCGE